MLLLFCTHSVLFYVGLINYNDFANNLQADNCKDLHRVVCVAQCLEKSSTQKAELILNSLGFDNNELFKTCGVDCIKSNEIRLRDNNSNNNVLLPKQIHENYILKLICRNDSSLNFRIDLHMKKNKSHQTPKGKAMIYTPTSSAESTIINSESEENNATEYRYGSRIFLIEVHLAQNAEIFDVYLSDDNFFTIDSLLANTTYNVSVTMVHSNNKYSVIAQQQQFSTLRRGYTPENITEIKVTNFMEDKWNPMFLTATLTWKPAGDLTCHYDVISFAPERAEFQPLEIRDPRQLYKYTMENLTFSSEYRVGIRAINTKNMRESGLFWLTFKAPSCIEWHNYNFNICAPAAPQALQIDQMFEDKNVYALNISWLPPTHLPDNYTLRIQDGETKIYHLKNDVHNVLIPRITLHGVFYEVSLTASTPGGHATTSYRNITKTVIHVPEKNPFVKLIAGILAPILCVAVLSLALYIIHHRRVKLKRYRKERSKYFQELEKKSPFDPKENYNLTTSIKQTSYACQVDLDELTLFNDDMEIDRKNLTLYEVLGEGAFGLVKRGVYKDDKEGTIQEVAVKMLKDHPSADEIRAFGLEIEVMKSVKKHPNIVSMIGHCTRLSTEMMLLTEYCSYGNLLNFLRDEWRFLHELQRRKQILSKCFVDIELPQITEPYNKKKESNNKENISTTPISPDHKQIVGVIKIKNNSELTYSLATKFNSFKHSSNEENDPANDNYITKKFKEKLKAAKMDIKSLKFFISNSNDNMKDIDSTIGNNAQHIEKLNAAIRKTEISSSSAPISEIISPVAENKSYDYHSNCTNSCKNDVDVIICNDVDAAATSRNCDTKALDFMVKEQQNRDTQITTPQCTAIEVKNCNCKLHHHHQQQQQQLIKNKNTFNTVVENLSYFKSYNSSMIHENLKDTLATPTPTNLKTTASATSNIQNQYPVSNINDYSRLPLACGDLLDIARQVAVGMEFLAKSKVVHRDLAARNILVTRDRTVKISDFGLSRDVYQENMYKKTGNGKLPIKWLALESMTHQVYTTQSDVWSYGVLLYEIVTLGATPYPSIPTNNLLELLKRGYRMEKPKNCGQEFYSLMRSCWNEHPNARPTFTEIVQKIDVMLKNFSIQTDDNTIKTEKETISSVSDKIEKLKELHYLSQHESSVQHLSSDNSYLTPVHQ